MNPEASYLLTSLRNKARKFRRWRKKMNNGFGDAKRNIFEHLCLSIFIFIAALFFDHIVNLLRAININLVRGEVGNHPYKIGEFQIIFMLLSALHFLRKINEFRYYGELLPKKLREMVNKEV